MQVQSQLDAIELLPTASAKLQEETPQVQRTPSSESPAKATSLITPKHKLPPKPAIVARMMPPPSLSPQEWPQLPRTLPPRPMPQAAYTHVSPTHMAHNRSNITPLSWAPAPIPTPSLGTPAVQNKMLGYPGSYPPRQPQQTPSPHPHHIQPWHPEQFPSGYPPRAVSHGPAARPRQSLHHNANAQMAAFHTNNSQSVLTNGIQPPSNGQPEHMKTSRANNGQIEYMKAFHANNGQTGQMNNGRMIGYSHMPAQGYTPGHNLVWDHPQENGGFPHVTPSQLSDSLNKGLNSL
ncbi:uncharacterized protein BCR38DRAFT_420940 [Pseudomassariella vexata]|uniref:Uncharacterized protein n=1 Tax=Pseudomassariella vexata TaxID=1141098 RepID=A0A1Y2EES2_9PEZI|nr:uncharacterized protein BCR38DRAFT_420940 [Pseudomassariella vexata]ORY70072.1 hypothetical protein BCR38DRAFT_420940 [Pseudomassariella vexata]